MIITRIGFCASCALAQNPKIDQKFLVYGNHTSTFHVRFAQCTPPYWGFVPHIYELHKKIGDNLIVMKSCAMDGCGVTFRWENEWLFMIKKHQREVWTLSQWNALVELKHNTFTKMYEI